MRTTKIITVTLLLATLFAGCKKESNDRIMIFADEFAVDSKVAIDPTDPAAGGVWIAGETINLNGTPYTITYDDASHGYYLNVAPDATDDMYAIYPAGSFGGNDVTVTNDYANGTGEVVLNRLLINLRSDGKQEMVFPMASHVVAGVAKMPFSHLTGGFRITLHNERSSEVKVASLKIVAQSTTDVTNISHDCSYNCSGYDVTARWAVQGPSVPNGGIGDNDQDVDVKYISEMNFDLKQGSENFATIAEYADLTPFCIPVTISSVHFLTIIGYDTDGKECFRVTKDLQADVDVLRNRMYNLPQISIN